MKKLIPSLFLLGIFVSTISLIPNKNVTAQANIGTVATTSGSYTHAYGWTDGSGTCQVRTFLYDMKSEDIGEGYAQSPQISVAKPNLTASSDHWENGAYLGYTQDN